MSESAERRWETQNELGCKLFGQGDLPHAEEAFIAAIREATLLGTENLRLASSLSNLGQLKYKQKDFPEAESLFRRALAIREQVLGAEHQGVLQSVNNLAALHYARGELEQAEAMFRRALWISERQLGYDHPDVAVTLNNLARLNFRRNDYAAAAPLLQRLLTIKQEALGGDHPEIAAILTSLAKVRCADRDYDAAEQLSRRALNVREKTFAADDPIIAISLEALAEICAARGKHDEELTLLERSLSIRQRAPGGEHPALVTTRERVAQLRAQFPAAARADGGLHELAELAGIDVLPEPPQVRREAPTGPRNAPPPQVRKETSPPIFTPSVEPVWHPNERFEPVAPSTEPSYDTMAPATMFARTEPSAPHAPWTPPASPVVYRPRTPPRVERRFHDEPISRPWPRPRKHRRRMMLTLAAIAAVGVTTWLVLGRQTAEETGALETEATTRAPRLTGDSLVGGYSVVRPPSNRPRPSLPPSPPAAMPAPTPAAAAPAPVVEDVRPLPPPVSEPSASARSSAAPRRAAADTLPAAPALSLPGVQLDRVTKEIEARRARVDSVANRVTVKPPTFEKQP